MDCIVSSWEFCDDGERKLLSCMYMHTLCYMEGSLLGYNLNMLFEVL